MYYCCAFAFVLPRKYHAITAHIANYISIEFSRTDNFVPLPTLRQLKYVSPNGKIVDSRVTRRALLCFHSQICNNTLSRFVVATYRLTYHERICTLSRSVIGSSLFVIGSKYSEISIVPLDILLFWGDDNRYPCSSRTYQKESCNNYIELQRMLALATVIDHYLLMVSSV